MGLSVNPLGQLAALTFAVGTVGLVGCGAPASGSGTQLGGDNSGSSTGSGGGGGSGGGNGGSGSVQGSSGGYVGGSGSGPAGSGSTPGGSGSGGSGSSPSSGNGGSGSSTSGSSGGSSSGSGTVTPTRGCGQATTCTPGADLPAPAAADGFQIVTPAQGFAISPGQEAYYCYYKTIPGGAAINVGSFQSWMTSGGSHHFILYSGGGGADGSVSGGSLVGGLGGCVPSGTWLYATSTSGQIIELKMPDGVGLPMPANQMLILNIHVINAGTTIGYPQLKLNVLYAKNVKYTAGSLVSFNAGISVPAGGTQDVRGYCSGLPAGSKFFAFTTHVHRHGGSVQTGAYTDVNFVTGGKTTNIVHSTDWENPDVALWGPPDFLTVSPSDQFTYDCHYVNKDAAPVTFGETAATSEMCMSIGYYFPVGVPTTGVVNGTYCH